VGVGVGCIDGDCLLCQDERLLEVVASQADGAEACDDRGVVRRERQRLLEDAVAFE
jgi:hypothetical protein